MECVFCPLGYFINKKKKSSVTSIVENNDNNKFLIEHIVK